MRIPGLFLLFGTCIALASLALPRSADAQNPDLNGRWKLNLEQSEDGRAKFQEAMRSARESGRRGGGGRPPPGGREGMRQQMQETLRMLSEAAMRLNIVAEDSTVTVVAAEGSRMIFYPDGREIEIPVEGAGTVQTKAEWKGDKLRVERRFEGGMKVTSEYEIKSDGAQLHVKVKFEGGRIPGKVEVLRVYDAESSADGG